MMYFAKYLSVNKKSPKQTHDNIKKLIFVVSRKERLKGILKFVGFGPGRLSSWVAGVPLGRERGDLRRRGVAFDVRLPPKHVGPTLRPQVRQTTRAGSSGRRSTSRRQVPAAVSGHPEDDDGHRLQPQRGRKHQVQVERVECLPEKRRQPRRWNSGRLKNDKICFKQLEPKEKHFHRKVDHDETRLCWSIISVLHKSL